jgi:glutathione S-transferase
MYELYYSPGACSLAPHILLRELGVAHRLTLVSVADGSTGGAEYLAINPKGRVPALRTSPTEPVLTEAVAILTYIARACGGEALLGETPDKAGRVLEWCVWLSTSLHASGFGALWRPARFANEPCQGVISEHGRLAILRDFSAIETRFADGRSWAVDAAGYTIADIFLLVFHRWGGRIGFDMAANYAAWSRHAARVRARPAVQQAWEFEGLS